MPGAPQPLAVFRAVPPSGSVHPRFEAGSVSRMNSSGLFSSSKYNLLYRALQTSGQQPKDFSTFNRSMSEARAQGMTWSEGLDYTVKKLKNSDRG